MTNNTPAPSASAGAKCECGHAAGWHYCRGECHAPDCRCKEYSAPVPSTAPISGANAPESGASAGALSEQIAFLDGEINRMAGTSLHSPVAMNFCRAILASLSSLAEVRVALWKYGDHYPECAVIQECGNAVKPLCNCGFDALIKRHNLETAQRKTLESIVTITPPASAGDRVFEFDRYRNGKLMAEGVVISRARTEEEARAIALTLYRDTADMGELRLRKCETCKDLKGWTELGGYWMPCPDCTPPSEACAQEAITWIEDVMDNAEYAWTPLGEERFANVLASLRSLAEAEAEVAVRTDEAIGLSGQLAEARRELDYLKRDRAELIRGGQEIVAQISDERAAAERDAERYRYFRTRWEDPITWQHRTIYGPGDDVSGWDDERVGKCLDDAIDAQLALSTPPREEKGE